ncbi:hypothetical protein D9M70_575900 [compost metagenome]
MLDPLRHAAVVAAVAMAVDDGQHGRLSQLAQTRNHAARDTAARAGVDNHDALARFDGKRVALTAQRMHARHQVGKGLASH